MYRQYGEQRQLITTEDGLSISLVTDVLVDREGLIWFATWGGGVCRCDPCGIGYPDLLRGEQVVSLLADGEHILIGARQRISCLSQADPGLLSDEISDLPLEPVALCRDGHGDLWIGGRTGLLRWDGTRLHQVGSETAFTGGHVRTPALDPQGRLLAGHSVRGVGDFCVSRLEHWRFPELSQQAKGARSCLDHAGHRHPRWSGLVRPGRLDGPGE